MSSDALEDILRDLPRHGALIKNRGYRQIWRFEHGGHSFYLKFYPRRGSRLKRMLRGNPALREFLRLQKLQKARVPSPRARNVLVGYRLDGRMGDAVIVEAIEPSVPLDQYLNDQKLLGEPIANHRQLAEQLRDLVCQLGKARLGHADLHLGNILLHDGKLFLLDGYAVRTAGLRLDDLMLLGHSVNRFATRTDLYRGWLELGLAGDLPKQNPVSPRQWRKLIERATQENHWFGRLSIAGWSGSYFKQSKYARRWAPASRLNITVQDWNRIVPGLLLQMKAGELEAIKMSRSGDVLATQIMLGDAAVPVIIKRPYKRYWYRYINEIGRGSRARRAWIKAWTLIARNIPTAWPLLMLEKRTAGYVTDSIIVFERLDGSTLASANLDEMEPAQRDRLFRRTGRILRQIDTLGLAHFDAKASNWIVVDDEKTGPRPVLIDVDGIRARRWDMLGLHQLLRAMLDHPQYTPADSLALCQGYAPYSPMLVRKEKEET